MKNLYKYLDKIGAEYRRETYGANYFSNAPALHFAGAVIIFDYSERPAGVECQKRKMIEKYCARYGYSVIMRGGWPGVNYFHVVKGADADALNLYNVYQSPAVAACEKYIHLWHVYPSRMTAKEQNDYLRGVMDYYGEQYNAARLAIETETATA